MFCRWREYRGYKSGVIQSISLYRSADIKMDGSIIYSSDERLKAVGYGVVAAALFWTGIINFPDDILFAVFMVLMAVGMIVMTITSFTRITLSVAAEKLTYQRTVIIRSIRVDFDRKDLSVFILDEAIGDARDPLKFRPAVSIDDKIYPLELRFTHDRDRAESILEEIIQKAG